jgi:hypothetical protein
MYAAPIDGVLPVYDAPARPTFKLLSLSTDLGRHIGVIREQATFHNTHSTDNYVD